MPPSGCPLSGGASSRRRAMTAFHVYELACLAGGPVRAVDTAVVTLLGDGRLTAVETGELVTVTLRYTHPVESAVLDAVGRRAHRSIYTVRYRCAEDERLTGLVEELVAAGLLRRARRPVLPRRSGSAWSATGSGRQVLRQARGEIPVGTPQRV